MLAEGSWLNLRVQEAQKDDNHRQVNQKLRRLHQDVVKGAQKEIGYRMPVKVTRFHLKELQLCIYEYVGIDTVHVWSSDTKNGHLWHVAFFFVKPRRFQHEGRPIRMSDQLVENYLLALGLQRGHAIPIIQSLQVENEPLEDRINATYHCISIDVMVGENETTA